MILRLLTLSLVLTACQSRNQTPETKPAAEGPPVKRIKTQDSAEAKKPEKPGPGTIEVEHATAWLKAYMELGEALVHSNPVDAAAHATAMLASEPPAVLKELAVGFPTDLKGQRLRFAKLSAELHKIWKADSSLQAKTAIMHCPMVPADWIQPAGILRNPYMPETMLHCGYQVLPEK